MLVAANSSPAKNPINGREDLYFDVELLNACIADTCADCAVIYRNSPRLTALLIEVQSSEDGRRSFRLAAARAVTISAALMVANEEGLAEVAAQLGEIEEPTVAALQFCVMDALSRQGIDGDPHLQGKLSQLAQLVQAQGSEFTSLL